MTLMHARPVTRRDAILGVSASVGLLAMPHVARAQSAARVVVVGGGFGGAACARALKRLDAKVQVTLLDVIDPVAVGEFETPEGDKRIVGIRIAMKNVSETQYDDSPSNGSVLIYGSDEQADATILAEGECSSGFASSAKIAPGARRQGCIPFEVPKGNKPKTFQFTLESGFGPQAGEWSLRGAKRTTATSSSPAGSRTGTSEQVTAATGTDCGDGVLAGPNTSCPFAQNVQKAWREAGGTPDTVRVFSPVTDQTYTMSCDSSGGTVTCAGGNNASVSFDA